MAGSQKMGRGRSGGQAINDHSFWAGGKSKASPFPEGVHTKEYMSAEGAGTEMDYEDTSEKIKATQSEGTMKAKARPLKANYRN